MKNLRNFETMVSKLQFALLFAVLCFTASLFGQIATDDTPFIDLSDKAGRTRATLEMTEEDTPALRLFNESGGTKFQIN